MLLTMGGTPLVHLVTRWLCSAQLGMYSAKCGQFWLNAPYVNDSGHYWHWAITHILSLAQFWGDAICLTWSGCHKAIHLESFRISWYVWWNPMMMWLCIRVVWLLSDKMWILNWIKLWKIHKNPSRVIAHLSACTSQQQKNSEDGVSSWGGEVITLSHTLLGSPQGVPKESQRSPEGLPI